LSLAFVELDRESRRDLLWDFFVAPHDGNADTRVMGAVGFGDRGTCGTQSRACP